MENPYTCEHFFEDEIVNFSVDFTVFVSLQVGIDRFQRKFHHCSAEEGFNIFQCENWDDFYT